jgi:OmpA-OmpF porin, OOP family
MKSRDARRPVPLGALALIALMAIASPAGAAAKDRAQVPSFPEAKVIKRSVHDLESYWIPLGKLSGDGQAEKVEVVEGKWTHVTYANPPKSSVIEIGRSFYEKLRDGGYEIVYDCRDGDCGQGGRKTNGDWWDPTFQRRYLVGRLARPEGDLWVCVNVQAKGPNAPGQHDVDVVEAKPEPQPDKVVEDETDAGWLEQELGASGHVAVHHIAIDDKKLVVLPGSEPTLTAIAQLFARDPRRKLMVVVHTDAAGEWKASVQRSRREAAAIVVALIKKHRVPAARIAGEGVGPLAPVASSATLEGRAKNRRVELVLQGVTPAPGLKANQTGE